MSIASKPITTEELLAMPDDGVDREIIRGELRESPMTTRAKPHCRTMTNLARLLGNWLLAQPAPRGSLYTGDVRVRLRRDPDTFVGADLAYVSFEVDSRSDPGATFIDGPPVLAIEILSSSDTVESIGEKNREYLAAGVSLVWELNPLYRTVTVHRPDAFPVLFNAEQSLSAEPHLPGFQTAVADIFAG
jgi:Uma2 family endonuclease